MTADPIDYDEQLEEPAAYDEPPRRFRSGASFILDAPHDVPAIWGTASEVLWAEGESLMVCGPQGVGKSTIIQQLVKARLGIGSGTVLGHPVTPGQGKVLYLACDRPRQISRSMARMFTNDNRQILEDRLDVWEGPPPYDFAKYTACLMRMCETAGADTVVVDSVKDVAIGLVDDSVGAAYNRARQTALAEGIQVIEAHHQTKRGAGGTAKAETLADVYGSVWLTAGAGSVVLIAGDAGDPIVELRHLKQPADPVGPLRVAHDHDTGTSRVWHATDLTVIARASLNGLTARKAASSLFATDKPKPAEVEKARRRLDALCRTDPPTLLKLTATDPNTSDTYWPPERLPITIQEHP